MCLGRENAPTQMHSQQQRVFVTAFNNTQLEILEVYLLLLPRMCAVKETAHEQKTFCEVVGRPPPPSLKGGTIIVAAAQTVTGSFCGQSKEGDEGKPDTNRPTVAADFIFQIQLNGKRVWNVISVENREQKRFVLPINVCLSVQK